MENEKRYTKIEKLKTIQEREISLKSGKTIKRKSVYKMKNHFSN